MIINERLLILCKRSITVQKINIRILNFKERIYKLSRVYKPVKWNLHYSQKILSLPPVNIEQTANSKDCSCENSDSQVFNKGKSCLFALPTMVLEKPLTSFPITMTVYKKLPPGVLPDVMLIGSHQIQAKDFINTVLQKRIFKTSSSPSTTSKEMYKITTATGQAVGEVQVFMRISCFGKKIITQFQIPRNRQPFLFKGELNSPVIQCKKIPSDKKLPAKNCVFNDANPIFKERRAVCGEKNFLEGENQCPAPPPSSPINLKSSLKSRGNHNKVEEYSSPGNVCFMENFPTVSERRGRPFSMSGFGGNGNQSNSRKCGCRIKTEKQCGCSSKS